VTRAGNDSRRRFLATSALGVIGLGLAACTGGTETDDPAVDAPTEADIGFCTDMSLHHEQALAMCQWVLGRDTGGSVQNAAAELLQSQSYERGTMHAWLAAWGRSTAPPTEVMGWMGMGMPAAEMPGLATDAQMQELAVAEGTEKGRLFLTLMRAHHVGGVHMADAAVEMAGLEEVRRLAARMSAQQTYEISLYDTLLSSTYA